MIRNRKMPFSQTMGPSLSVTLRSYLTTLFKVMSWKVALTLGLMVCLGLTEGVSLLMLVPLLQLVGLDVQQGIIGRIAEFINSIFATVGIRPTLIAVLGFYVLIIVIHSLLKRWENSVSLTLQYEFVVHLRQRLYRAIANANWLFFARSRVSDFTHALTFEMCSSGPLSFPRHVAGQPPLGQA
jgi:ATP-binding cassette subfamily C protein